MTAKEAAFAFLLGVLLAATLIGAKGRKEWPCKGGEIERIFLGCKSQ